MHRHQTVSFDNEPLVLVDESDHVVGHEEKSQCHHGLGLLHRAFSVFLLNERGEVLLQQRSEQKRLWPLYWSNACCSHPRRGESTDEAVKRRLHEELSVSSNVRFLFKFQYHATFGDAGSEHELCHVYMGRIEGVPRPNTNEVHDMQWLDAQALDSAIATASDAYTPWLKLEWARIRKDFWESC